MNREVVVRPEAQKDVREARSWYRDISPQLGERFIDSVDQAISLLTERPEAFQVVYESLRRLLLRRFPYAVFYAVTADKIIVAAVLHQARDPRTLSGRSS